MSRPNQLLRHGCTAFLLGLLSGCTHFPLAGGNAPVQTTIRHDDVTPRAMLAYGREVAEFDDAAFARELRKTQAAKGNEPAERMRLALLHAQPRTGSNPDTAIDLLKEVLADTDPAAASLHSLARILHVQLATRARLRAQNEALLADQQAGRDALANLQKKLDALTDIERSLASPARAGTEKTQ